MTDQDARLAGRLLTLGDDELILGHNDSLWTGRAPILEEDIAMANIAQDEIGHAILWYGLLAQLRGEDERYPDRLVFQRDAAGFRNVRLVELPNGDWAFSMLRQYLFDAYELAWLTPAARSTRAAVAEAAATIRREEVYHLKHTGAWVRRLGLGTEESHRRAQTALDVLWPAALQLFAPIAGEAELARDGVLPALDQAHDTWRGVVEAWLRDSGLAPPALTAAEVMPDREHHTEHLAPLLAAMQAVARADPQADW